MPILTFLSFLLPLLKYVKEAFIYYWCFLLWACSEVKLDVLFLKQWQFNKKDKRIANDSIFIRLLWNILFSWWGLQNLRCNRKSRAHQISFLILSEGSTGPWKIHHQLQMYTAESTAVRFSAIFWAKYSEDKSNSFANINLMYKFYVL